MAHTKEEVQKFRIGYLEAKEAIKSGRSQEDLLETTDDPAKRAGIRRAFQENVEQAFEDSAHEFRDAIISRDLSRMQDSAESLIDSSYNLVDSSNGKIIDTSYTFEFNGNDAYTLLKDGVPTYHQWKEGSAWKCDCPAFKYHNTCKHLDMLHNWLKSQGKTGGKSAERLPQHLARVRQLEKSVETWQQRVNDNPNDKVAQKQLLARQEALKLAKEKAEEIEALPKPTRHAREEFEGVIPQLDKLFDGIADYEIVGSWRRGKDTYKDCDILTVMNPSQWKQLRDRLESDPNFGPAPGHTHADLGDDVVRGGYKNGDRVDYLDINRVTDPENYGAWLLFRTGSADFNIACRGYLKKFGCGLNEHGIILPDKSYMNLPTEQKFFDALGISFIDPKDREDAKKFWSEVRKIDKPAFLNDIKDSATTDSDEVSQARYNEVLESLQGWEERLKHEPNNKYYQEMVKARKADLHAMHVVAPNVFKDPDDLTKDEKKPQAIDVHITRSTITVDTPESHTTVHVSDSQEDIDYAQLMEVYDVDYVPDVNGLDGFSGEYDDICELKEFLESNGHHTTDPEEWTEGVASFYQIGVID